MIRRISEDGMIFEHLRTLINRILDGSLPVETFPLLNCAALHALLKPKQDGTAQVLLSVCGTIARGKIPCDEQWK